jgi:transglutaminase-like putative cysteine protease
MHLVIRHVTQYRYDRPVPYAAQAVRLAPTSNAHQHVLSWWVTDGAGRALPASTDGYGNVLHVRTIVRPHSESALWAEGEVETSESDGVLRGVQERLPPLYFLRTTPLTEPDAAAREIAAKVAGEADPVRRLHDLMLLIRERIDYVVGTTSVSTTVAEAIAHGQGVCQDHAQVFVACARLLGHPARYVSGYMWPGPDPAGAEAAHAWAEARVEDLGWVGFDAANRICPTEAYVRVAIGLDYLEAAPVRGVRRGAAEEGLAVSVEVQQRQGQQ